MMMKMFSAALIALIASFLATPLSVAVGQDMVSEKGGSAQAYIIKTKIAENLPDMTYAEYVDCSIASAIAEGLAEKKGQSAVVKRSDVWTIAADKRSNPATVSLDELLAEPKLMPMLQKMSNGEKPNEDELDLFTSTYEDCNTTFLQAVEKTDL